MNARMTRKFTSLVAEHDTAFILVTHLTTDIGSMSRDPLVISGGSAIIYAASIILDLRKRFLQESDPIEKDEGIKIGVTVKKNHCVPDKNPYVKTEYYAVFGQGIEQYLSTLERALEEGVLVARGAFIRDPGADGEPLERKGEKLQWQGKQKFRQFVIDNPDYLEELTIRVGGGVIPLTAEEIEDLKKDDQKIAKSAAKSSLKAAKKKDA